MSAYIVAVPSRSGRNKGRGGTVMRPAVGRRPLKVGSEPEIHKPLQNIFDRRRPLKVGSERAVWHRKDHNRQESPSPQGRVGTSSLIPP